MLVKKPFLFKESVCDHGWIWLEPCRWVERLTTGKVVLIGASSHDANDHVKIEVQIHADTTQAERTEIDRKLRHMLRLDEDFSEFYELAASHPELSERIGQGRGRLLRSPTLFEDVVKTICTTNTTWTQTKAMVKRIVNTLGDPLPTDSARHAFPTPEQIAHAKETLFEKEIRLGYRNTYVQELARRIVEGTFDLEAIPQAELSTKELKKLLKSIKGVGDYAANILLMILGHYHELAFDTELRGHVRKKYFHGEMPTSKEIAALYERWGKWKYLAYWFDPPAPDVIPNFQVKVRGLFPKS